jgi:hypothetical protein
VCNNPHQLRAIGIEPAPSRESGLLSVYVATPPQPKTPIGQFLRDKFGVGDRPASHFLPMSLPDLHVDGPGRGAKMVAVIDGDVVHVRGPLVYRIRSTPLRMLLPAKNP